MQLVNYIKKHKSSSTLFSYQKKDFNVNDFLSEVKLARYHFQSELKDKNICLKLKNAYEFIVMITALDGLCSSILLLPHELDIDSTEALSIEHESVMIIDKLEFPLSAKNDETETCTEVEYATETDWVLATSGTTGRPKLIIHTLASLIRTCKILKQPNKNQITWGLVYQPQRFAGLQVVLQSMLAGNKLVIADGEFQSQVEALIYGEVNCLSATPSMWRKLLIDGKIKELGFLQITLGGEACDKTILNSLSKAFPNSRMFHIYASTEAGVGFSVKDKQEGFPKSWLENGTDGVEMKISKGKTLLIRPNILPTGSEITNRLDNNGFIDSGDVVSITGERVIFQGRESGAINVGGNKVHPEEIETVLREFHEILDVKVYGKKNPMIGQLVVADIVLEQQTNNKDELKVIKKLIISRAKKKLELYKVPTFLTFVDEIIINSTGKVDRNNDG